MKISRFQPCGTCWNCVCDEWDVGPTEKAWKLISDFEVYHLRLQHLKSPKSFGHVRRIMYTIMNNFSGESGFRKKPVKSILHRQRAHKQRIVSSHQDTNPGPTTQCLSRNVCAIRLLVLERLLLLSKYELNRNFVYHLFIQFLCVGSRSIPDIVYYCHYCLFPDQSSLI